ncbi:Ubiquitin-related modifier 1 [Nymphon striatum]|nr:Ubiquitin-related modifier 1 [Nymphon striatum]
MDNDSSGDIGEHKTKAAKPKNEDIISKFIKQLEPRFNQLDNLQPILNELVALRKHMAEQSRYCNAIIDEQSPQELQLMVEELRNASNEVGLEINLSETKVMFNRNVEIQPIMTGNVSMDQVDRYTYLGQLISIHRDWEPEVRRRVALGWQAFGRLNNVWRSKLPFCLKRKAELKPMGTMSCPRYKPTYYLSLVFVFIMSIIFIKSFRTSGISKYNSLTDPYLGTYFNSPKIFHHLLKSGLVRQLISIHRDLELEVRRRVALGWQAFGRLNNVWRSKLLLCLKRKDKCVLPVLTWVRAHTGCKDLTQTVKSSKWNWAEHLTRRTDDRWTNKSTIWITDREGRKRGKPKRRWVDDIAKSIFSLKVTKKKQVLPQKSFIVPKKCFNSSSKPKKLSNTFSNNDNVDKRGIKFGKNLFNEEKQKNLNSSFIPPPHHILKRRNIKGFDSLNSTVEAINTILNLDEAEEDSGVGVDVSGASTSEESFHSSTRSVNLELLKMLHSSNFSSKFARSQSLKKVRKTNNFTNRRLQQSNFEHLIVCITEIDSNYNFVAVVGYRSYILRTVGRYEAVIEPFMGGDDVIPYSYRQENGQHGDTGWNEDAVRGEDPKLTNSLSFDRALNQELYQPELTILFLGTSINQIQKKLRRPSRKNLLKHQITVKQQLTEGPAISIFKGSCYAGEEFTFSSRRSKGRPFSIVIFVDDVIDLKVNTCCEYRHRIGNRLGGSKGHFQLRNIRYGKECYQCLLRAEDKKKSSSNVRHKNSASNLQSDVGDCDQESSKEKRNKNTMIGSNLNLGDNSKKNTTKKSKASVTSQNLSQENLQTKNPENICEQNEDFSKQDSEHASDESSLSESRPETFSDEQNDTSCSESEDEDSGDEDRHSTRNRCSSITFPKGSDLCGGAELLFDGIKKHEVNLPIKENSWTMKDLIRWTKENLLKSRPELFVQGETVRPGILVLINDADWELMDQLEYKLEDNDCITFISTLHGG